jgi:hypothetical protein
VIRRVDVLAGVAIVVLAVLALIAFNLPARPGSPVASDILQRIDQIRSEP